MTFDLNAALFGPTRPGDHLPRSAGRPDPCPTDHSAVDPVAVVVELPEEFCPEYAVSAMLQVRTHLLERHEKVPTLALTWVVPSQLLVSYRDLAEYFGAQLAPAPEGGTGQVAQALVEFGASLAPNAGGNARGGSGVGVEVPGWCPVWIRHLPDRGAARLWAGGVTVELGPAAVAVPLAEAVSALMALTGGWWSAEGEQTLGAKWRSLQNRSHKRLLGALAGGEAPSRCTCPGQAAHDRVA